jgi:uncharacterized membrane protein YeaQ/YmgE (transglycosylase-associated protein family)
VVGVIRAAIGGFAFGLLGFCAGGLAGCMIASVVGAGVRLFVVDLVKKKTW